MASNGELNQQYIGGETLNFGVTCRSGRWSIGEMDEHHLNIALCKVVLGLENQNLVPFNFCNP